MYACWWSHLWDEETELYKKKLLSSDLAMRYMKDVGFKNISTHVVKEHMYDKTYYQVMNVTDKSYRDRDSFFALLSKERLDEGI